MRKKQSKELHDGRRRSEELNTLLMDQQNPPAQLNQTQVPYISGLLDTSVSTAPADNEQPLFSGQDYASRSNSLPRKLNHSSSMVMKDIYSDVNNGAQVSNQYQQPSRSIARVDNSVGQNYCYSSTPRDSQYQPTYQYTAPISQPYSQPYLSYRPNSAGNSNPRLSTVSTNPYLSGGTSNQFSTYPAFQNYNGSPSNHSEVSTDTYANLPKSFSMSRPRVSAEITPPHLNLSKELPSKSRMSTASARFLQTSKSLRFSQNSNQG